NILGLGRYDYGRDKFVSSEFYESMRRGHVRSGDVLLYKDGAQIGRKSLSLFSEVSKWAPSEDWKHRCLSWGEWILLTKNHYEVNKN
ncbi:MAG: hypothetical protein MUO29_04140, partial [Desulfobacterales bacterium]|nr:hypothetical protein [Desulfobacterales bacterium]